MRLSTWLIVAKNAKAVDIISQGNKIDTIQANYLDAVVKKTKSHPYANPFRLLATFYRISSLFA